MTKEKKRKISFTECCRCGERYIDDPWYEHKCERSYGLLEYMGMATKPERGVCSTASALTHQTMERAYRDAMMYGRPGGMQTEIVRAPEHEERRRVEREIATRSRSYGEYMQQMERYQAEVNRRQNELIDMYRGRVSPPNTEWRNRIFRGATAGLSPDAADARDYEMFYDEATS